MLVIFLLLNVNNQSLTQVLQLYFHVSVCLEAIRPWHNLSTGGHGHVIRMLDMFMPVSRN